MRVPSKLCTANRVGFFLFCCCSCWTCCCCCVLCERVSNDMEKSFLTAVLLPIKSKLGSAVDGETWGDLDCGAYSSGAMLLVDTASPLLVTTDKEEDCFPCWSSSSSSPFWKSDGMLLPAIPLRIRFFVLLLVDFRCSAHSYHRMDACGLLS